MKNSKMKQLGMLALFVATGSLLQAQEKGNPADTEVWEPIPAVVNPGKTNFDLPPSDAIILFDKDNLDEWESTRDHSPAKWVVNGDYVTVHKPSGDIKTKQVFKDYQLHIEWKVPAEIEGEGQARGNSGVFLAATNGNAGGYEIQVLDGYNNENKTYANGMVGSIYKQTIPLVNPSRKPGEWNVYDLVWTAPEFNADGSVRKKARMTAFLNGVLVQCYTEIQGETAYIGKRSEEHT